MKKKIKILIVEDEVLIARWLKMELEDAAYEVFDFVTTGEEAIKIALTKKPDIILMDIHLASNMDGITAAREIHTKIDIPIIIMTGYNKDDTFKRAQKVKPVAFLEKPVDLYTIKPVIDLVFE